MCHFVTSQLPWYFGALAWKPPPPGKAGRGEIVNLKSGHKLFFITILINMHYQTYPFMYLINLLHAFFVFKLTN